VLEQPLDFTHLAEKYNAYVTGFIQAHAKVGTLFVFFLPASAHCSRVHASLACMPAACIILLHNPPWAGPFCIYSSNYLSCFVQVLTLRPPQPHKSA
jgi:hypothetical protein